MGFYKYLAEAWKKPSKEVQRKRYIQWRKENRFVKIEKPTRIDRARSLGYKAKPGFVVVRARIGKGGRKRPRAIAARKPTKLGVYFNPDKNLQRISEERVQRKYPNLEVLNSYWVGDDAHHEFYEIVLVDPNHPQIRSDKDINWICAPQNRRRVYRGLTSAGKKSRGLRK
ncbi:TPA: 50S ribosomal protein L15e [archaeon]|uniref:50S ribosomal protein L15e n=1 Tax=Candidatus Naiadarchaeum limnaeum TaxID=2756139 RepID=A0A832V4Y6_9ARCH|nr:50S ribosomal protein L15e [Candidatus Naiadarchaeales archaeon SRR2090153.bin1042]HIK00330.1 50S ribosomal protein L15e [Candidatus Naiadarchaeum limnaeum]